MGDACHRRWIRLYPQPTRRLDPVHQRHADVHQDDIGLQRADGAHDLAAMPALADDQKPERLTEDRAKAGPDQILVVDE